MTKPRLPGSKTQRRSLAQRPSWYVRLYLGDQCDWFIGGKVEALTEQRAIAAARVAVKSGWPFLAPHVECAPATAKQAVN